MTSTHHAIKERIGLIGCGVMGESLAKGLSGTGLVRPGNFNVSDAGVDFTKKDWVERNQVNCYTSNLDCVGNSDVVILAVKPMHLEALFNQLKTGVTANTIDDGGDQPENKKTSLLSDKLVISLVSGFSLEMLANFHLGTSRIIRIMPNTPAVVRESTTAITAGPDVPPYDVELVQKIMSGIGSTWLIPERRMNTWTATAGAGPAYVFQFMEALANSAVAGGIPRKVANEMAIQAVYGAAKMAKESTLHLAELRDNVCSPSGVTIRGIQALHEKAFSGTIMQAVEAARNRYDQIEQNPKI